MNDQSLKTDSPDTIKEVLGYLNFSSGNRDTRFFQSLNDLYAKLAQSDFRSVSSSKKNIPNHPQSEHPKYSEPSEQNENTSFLALRVIEYLEQELFRLSQESDAFVW